MSAGRPPGSRSADGGRSPTRRSIRRGDYAFGWGTASDKLTGPAVSAIDLGPLDLVLLTHDQHGDNLDGAGRALLPTVPRVLTTRTAATRLGVSGARGLRPGATHGSSPPVGNHWKSPRLLRGMVRRCRGSSSARSWVFCSAAPGRRCGSQATPFCTGRCGGPSATSGHGSGGCRWVCPPSSDGPGARHQVRAGQLLRRGRLARTPADHVATP